MAEGVVRWFNSEKGHGYIAPDGGGPDVFVHYSSIQMNGYKTLDEGERVSFAVGRGPDGEQATKVTPLGVRGVVPPVAPAAPAPAAASRRPFGLTVAALITLGLLPVAAIVAGIAGLVPLWISAVVIAVCLVVVRLWDA
jgi:CspA family cold shock protein